MNIGIVTTWFERGAAMVSKAYRDVLVREHKVFIYARGGEQYALGNPAWDHNYVTWGTKAAGYGLTGVLWKDFSGWLKRHGIELVIFNEQHDLLPVVLARRLTDVTLAAYVDYYTQQTVPSFDLYDILLCNTARHHSVFKHHPGAIYVPWGTDVDLFRSNSRPIDPQCVVFFHSAGMSPGRKGTPQVVDAFRQVHGRCRLVLHLQLPLGSYPALEKACRDDVRIEVVDRPITSPGLYHRGDVYVYPAVLDGIGLTVPEALACGLPVVTVDTPPMNEFVKHGVNGRLVTPFEYRSRADGYYWPEAHCRVEDVARQMQHYVEHADALGEHRRKARLYAEEHLDWAKNAMNLSSGLCDLATGAVRRPLRELEESILATCHLPGWRFQGRRLARRAGMLKHRWVRWAVYE